MTLRLGVDVACRAAHQASLADEQGRFVWAGRRFRTTPQDLARLWAMLPAGTDPADVLIVMEPTRNAWVPLAAWFRRHGAEVVLVPPERSADLRAYYAKHSKSDRLDSQLLARLPMLHPDGLHRELGLGPGDALKRAAKLHSTLTHRRSQSLARLDALLEILGPAWHAAIGADLGNRTPLKFLAAGYADPHVVKRLGKTRLTRFCYRHSRGAWGEPHADALLAAAAQTLELWAEDELDYPDLAEDIAIEARLALQLTEEIKDLDERTSLLLNQADPRGILASAPGVGEITAAAILGRLGDPNRFASLAGARAFTGLVPTLDASGLNGRHGGPTKRGDAVLRQALFMAAGQARRIDPSLAAKYQRLMVDAGKHHNSALCHIATTLLTRVIACWRSGQPYVLRDVDGAPVSIEQARAIIAERYAIPADLRARRRTTNNTGTDRRSKESQRAPSTGPSEHHATTAA
jgi:transposase